MKKSNKINLQDPESMAIIYSTIRNAFIDYSAHKQLSERHYIKLECTKNTIIIIKMFSTWGTYDTQYVTIDACGKISPTKPYHMYSTLYYDYESEHFDDMFPYMMEMIKTLCEIELEDYPDSEMVIKYNFDEKDPKHYYNKLVIGADPSDIENYIYKWAEFVVNELPVNTRSICTGCMEINLFEPEYCKAKFSAMIEKRKVYGKTVYYLETVGGAGECSSSLSNKEGIVQHITKFASRIKKLEGYILPSKGETVTVNAYIEEKENDYV